MIAVGDVLNETYEVIGEIGQGGTGVVYLAYHRRLQKQVVIKKIREDFVGKIYERAEADLLKSLYGNGLCGRISTFLLCGRRSEIFSKTDSDLAASALPGAGISPSPESSGHP